MYIFCWPYFLLCTSDSCTLLHYIHYPTEHPRRLCCTVNVHTLPAHILVRTNKYMRILNEWGWCTVKFVDAWLVFCLLMRCMNWTSPVQTAVHILMSLSNKYLCKHVTDALTLLLDRLHKHVLCKQNLCWKREYISIRKYIHTSHHHWPEVKNIRWQIYYQRTAYIIRIVL